MAYIVTRTIEGFPSNMVNTLYLCFINLCYVLEKKRCAKHLSFTGRHILKSD